MKRRVVITGTGTISPLGNDTETLWNNIKHGNSGIQQLTSSDFDQVNTRIAGCVEDFQGDEYLEPKETKRHDLFVQYAYAAAVQALEESDLPLQQLDKDRAGIYIGSGAGGLNTLMENYQTMLDKGAKRVSPFMLPTSITNMASGLTAIKTGFTGPSFSPSSACATGNHAIGEAYHTIAHGYADVMLAGGSEAPINPLYFAGFAKMGAMSTKNETPGQASQPFNRDRDGFVMAEGAGVLLLEDYDHAKQRGAEIVGEIIGYGSTTDAYHMTSPSPLGAQKAMKLALERSGLSTKDVDYINAHGTGTPTGDISETEAIQGLFGNDAGGLKVSSTKSMTGHLFGAAGGVESIITLKSLQNDTFPPTINLHHPDPDCTLNYVSNEAEKGSVEVALSNGFGFGGHNAVLAFKKYH
ncbi:beta-ketoacyl-ACP synthase II [Salimicrobium album]|uniref:3-oxoacyl-[acyl-carrier-protein] synthase 2 n=1 Tax=Salimicrobium album TaxID=50717 RepID=A0A1H3H0Y7_9BACI|nr:beta-ketoacyl-ACP synthase II [Salimicrobium album]SDY09186.1 3-oxoacyl-[acyl-carrier-protein] synthase II [Salimicrobium album]